MCNFCHKQIEKRAAEAAEEDGEGEEQEGEDDVERRLSPNVECEYVHLVEEIRDLFEEEESSRGIMVAYCKVRLHDDILREVSNSEDEKSVGVLNIKVCMENKEMELTLNHLLPHPKPEYKGDSVLEAALHRIEEMANTNIRRGDVYNMLCLEGLIDPEQIRRAQVNFWMAEKLDKLYVRNADNQLLSSKLLIESFEFQLKGFEEKGLKSIFAVTDKDVGQIGGLEETFPKTYVQMCLWHAQRAVELRIQLLDSPIHPYDAVEAHAIDDFINETWVPGSLLQRGHICPVELKKPVIGMFNRHYDLSPLVPDRDGQYGSSKLLCKRACMEAYEWCRNGIADNTDPDNAADGPDDYLRMFKEKWARLVQNTEYLVEKEHDNQKFIEALDKALYTFDMAIGQCMTALRSGQE
ncbi:hypothetical protein R1flu_009182 [Riccia fluitans]|uniref:MULE transposase domain-containing protein n=1 Tax=Riccia fluitans TaxID=41844 RepID=A0ABD1Z1C0_9MARC